MSFLENLCTKASVTIPAETSWQVDGTNTIRVTKHGVAFGFTATMGATSSAKMIPSWKKLWNSMADQHILHSKWDDGHHLMHDILVFLVACQKFVRADGKRHISKANSDKIHALQLSLAQWMSSWINRYIMLTYCAIHDTSRPIPALGRGNNDNPNKRKLIKI